MANTFTSSDFSFELSHFLFISYHMHSDIHELGFQHVTETHTINAAIGKKTEEGREEYSGGEGGSNEYISHNSALVC
jgi:hypothetical protein